MTISLPPHATSDVSDPAGGEAAGHFQDAERRLLEKYGVIAESRRVRLIDPALDARVLETGAGEPLLVLHGSGMSAGTWAPLLPHLQDRRIHAFDLPGFGLSDAHDYTGRTPRRHAVAQVGSMLDALGLERVTIVGTSLGAMWALCMALEQPRRVRSVVGQRDATAGGPGRREQPPA